MTSGVGATDSVTGAVAAQEEEGAGATYSVTGGGRGRRSRLRRLADTQAGSRSTFIMSPAREKAKDATQRNTRAKTPAMVESSFLACLTPKRA